MLQELMEASYGIINKNKGFAARQIKEVLPSSCRLLSFFNCLIIYCRPVPPVCLISYNNFSLSEFADSIWLDSFESLCCRFSENNSFSENHLQIMSFSVSFGFICLSIIQIVFMFLLILVLENHLMGEDGGREADLFVSAPTFVGVQRKREKGEGKGYREKGKERDKGECVLLQVLHHV